MRPHRCVAPRRLTAHPAESEHPEAEINNCCTLLYLSNKVCEQNLMKRKALLIELSEDSTLEQCAFHICFEMEDDQSMHNFPDAERTLYENGWESIFLPGFIGIELLQQ